MEKHIEVNPLGYMQPLYIKYVDRYYERTQNTGVEYYDKYKISILLSDGIAAVVNNNVLPTAAGDIVFFRPDETHFGRILKSGHHKFIDIMVPIDYFDNFCLSTENITRFLRHEDKTINRICFEQKTKEIIISLAQKLADDIEKDAKTLETYICALDIINICSKEYAEQKNDMSRHVPDQVSKALRYISDNFNKKLTLDEIAKASSCSVTYLSKVFKKFVGCTPYEHLIYCRMINAEKLLRNGKNVTEACFESGYFDCSHFIKAFKKHTGLTPKDYIHKHNDL